MARPASRASLATVQLVGGLAVLASYAYGLSTALPGGVDAFWGEVPEALRPLYTVSMLAAAAGYLAFSHYVLFRLDPADTRLPGGLGYSAFTPLYLLILLPSALWMPLTFEMIQQPGPALWLAIRGVLLLVGAAALAMIAALAGAQPAGPPGARRLALVGAAAFAFQTALLDALVWPAFFPV